jgi:replicative DNA helicase
MKLKKRRIDSYTEKRILTGMIVSTEFMSILNPVIQINYFQSNYGRTVAKWCVEFYEQYEQAPFDHIQDIFDQRSSELNEEADLVKALLSDISEKYENNAGLNVPYMIDKAFEFFKKRELELTVGNMQILLGKNDLEGAERQVFEFSKIAAVTSDWSSPFDPENIKEVFKEENRLFKMAGDLGRYMGGWDRGWLIAIAAPFKRGKTFSLQEIAVEAMFKKLKVVFISLEMHKKDMFERLYKRLVSASNPDGGIDVFPCFDCSLNQTDECDREERPVQDALLDEEERKPEYSPDLEYIPCTHCKNDPKLNGFYIEETWWESIERPPWREPDVAKHIASLEKIYRKYFQFKRYARYSANLSDVLHDIEVLEKTEGFIPDMIVIDYADILKPEDGESEGIGQLDATWKTLSKLAGERHAIVVTASQVNRGGLNKKNVESSDLAMWIGKLGHVDAMFTLNQTNDEKKNGVMKVGTMVKRFEDYSTEDTCTILQNLKYGQFCLDSHF